jgi:hypothetical protein
MVEVDEMHSYIGSKKTAAGSGLLLIDMRIEDRRHPSRPEGRRSPGRGACGARSAPKKMINVLAESYPKRLPEPKKIINVFVLPVSDTIAGAK